EEMFSLYALGRGGGRTYYLPISFKYEFDLRLKHAASMGFPQVDEAISYQHFPAEFNARRPYRKYFAVLKVDGDSYRMIDNNEYGTKEEALAAAIQANKEFARNEDKGVIEAGERGFFFKKSRS